MVPTGMMSAQDTVALLAEAGLFDNAVALAQLFSVNLKNVFEVLTKKCLQTEGSTTPKLLMDGPPEKESTLWKQLETYLEEYDGQGTNYQYYGTVTERILSTDSRIQLPPWLASSFKKKNPASLLRLFMKYSQLEAAAKLTLELLVASIGDKTSVHGGSAFVSLTRWLPWNAIDQLLLQLKSDKSFVSLYHDLQIACNQYFGMIDQQ